MSLRTLALAATLLSGAFAAQATLLTNGSFETPAGVTGPVSAFGQNHYCYLNTTCSPAFNSAFGWAGNGVVIAADSVSWQNPGGLPGYAFGLQLVGLQNLGFIEQTLSLAAGTYRLTWADSNRTGFNGDGNTYEVRVDGGTLGSFTTAPGDAWAGNSISFTVAAGSHTLRLQGLRSSGDGTSFIDDLELVAVGNPVPEPVSLALASAALAGLALSRRRRC